jgi:hypothetical protein
VPTAVPTSLRHPRAASADVGRPTIWRIAPLILLLTLAGCARPTGDFGRAEHNVLHDEVMPAIGKARAKGSDFNLADQEVEMRDRIWRYLVAPCL